MQTASEHAYDVTRHNVRMLCTEVAWAGIPGGVLASFLSIFALRLGASPVEVGLLTTGPALAGIIFPLPAAWLVRRTWGKLVVVLPLFLYRMLFAALVCIAWLPAPSRVAVLVAAVGLLSVSLAFFNTAFVPLVAKVLPQDIRARVVSIRGTVAGLTSTITVLVAGKVLDIIPFPLNFQVIFAVAFVTAQLSTWLVSRVEVPAFNEDVPLRGATADRSSAAARRLPWRAPFWRFSAGAVMLLLGIYIPSALYPIVLVDKLHATNGWIGALGTAGGLCGVVFAVLWGRASMRLGNRRILVVSSIFYALVPLGASQVASLPAYIPVSLAAGGLITMVGLGLFQCLLEVTPERQQIHYVAVYSMMASCATASAPLIGTYVLSTAGMTRAFELAAACIILGSLLIALVDVHVLIRVVRRLRRVSTTPSQSATLEKTTGVALARAIPDDVTREAQPSAIEGDAGLQTVPPQGVTANTVP